MTKYRFSLGDDFAEDDSHRFVVLGEDGVPLGSGASLGEVLKDVFDGGGTILNRATILFTTYEGLDGEMTVINGDSMRASGRTFTSDSFLVDPVTGQELGRGESNALVFRVAEECGTRGAGKEGEIR